MADRVLFISWGSPIPGREERGLEVFNEAIGLHGRLQQDGRTESFDVVLLGANGGGINGYIEVSGLAERSPRCARTRSSPTPTLSTPALWSRICR